MTEINLCCCLDWHSMADTGTPSKRKYMTSFSNVSQEEAEAILGFRLAEFYESQIPIEQFITKTAPVELKREIFKRLSDYMISEGFPAAALSSCNESIVTDHVGVILTAMISHHKRMMARKDLMLKRGIQVISTDEQMDENIECLVIHTINVDDVRYVVVVEGKRGALASGLPQLLLALKSMWDLNGDRKLVYGFLTTAIEWQLVVYDGQTWKIWERCTVLLPNMVEKEDRWLKNNTQILDVIYSVLSLL